LPLGAYGGWMTSSWITCSWTRRISACIPTPRPSRCWPPGGITTDGKRVFIGLAPAGSESTDAWADFLGELTDRGLHPPLLGISDGAPGLISALETTFRPSLRQRCLIHYGERRIMWSGRGCDRGGAAQDQRTA
jgi:hypothetical protein